MEREASEKYKRVLEMSGHMSPKEQAFTSHMYMAGLRSMYRARFEQVLRGTDGIYGLGFRANLNGKDALITYAERIQSYGSYEEAKSAQMIIDDPARYGKLDFPLLPYFSFMTFYETDTNRIVGGELLVIDDGRLIKNKKEVLVSLERRTGMDPYAEVLGL